MWPASEEAPQEPGLTLDKEKLSLSPLPYAPRMNETQLPTVET